MQVREVKKEERAQWDDFVLNSSQGSFLQTWEWGEVQQTQGQKIWRLVVEENAEWKAVLLLVRRELPLGRCWLYGPGGPVFREKRKKKKENNIFVYLQSEIEELAGTEGAVWVRWDAPLMEKSSEGENWKKTLVERGWQKSEREVQPKETWVLDLAQTEEELLAGMKSKTRYNVRLASRKAVTVRFSKDVKDIELFWRLTDEVSGRGSFRYHPREYYEVILREMNAGAGKVEAEVAIAEHEGEVLAAHIMIYAGSKATYVHGASSNKRREVMAPAFLYWETITRAKEKGCLVYDFWGVAPEGAGKDHPWSGVTRIKQGFGGRQEIYTGAYDFITQPWMYQMIGVARRARKMLT